MDYLTIEDKNNGITTNVRKVEAGKQPCIADIQDGQRRRITSVLFSWLPAGHENQMIHGFISAHQMFLPYIQFLCFALTIPQ